MAIINMQTMRYINLLDKASNVKTRKCFVYNNTIYFEEVWEPQNIRKELEFPAKFIPELLNPEAASKIQTSMILGVAFAEAIAIYSLVIALVLRFT